MTADQSPVAGRALTRRGFLAMSAGAVGATLAGCETSPPPRTNPARRSPAPSDRPTTPAVEQAMQGTANWHVHRTGTVHEIEGFAVPEGGPPGQRVRLFLSSTRGRTGIEAFRMGWYGGTGARRVWSKQGVTLPNQSRKTHYAAATRMVSAAWEPVEEVDTTGWPEGAYLFRLTAEGGAQRFVPYIVTSQEADNRLLLVHPTATWQAYNDWGGRSLYHGPGGSSDYSNRSYVVSMDRPLPLNGAVSFLSFDRPVVELVERLRLPVAHTTSEALHANGQLATQARAVVSLGHDEYWSPQMRAHVTQARDQGTNLLLLGANACFRRIRFADSPLGADREVICYKTDYRLDPDYGHDNRAVTNDWREPPAADPESSLIGTLYEGFPTEAAYTVTDPAFWAFRGIRLQAGEQFAGIVGPEYDRVNPAYPLCRPIHVFSHSKVVCNGVHSYSDSAYYTHRGGAGVLNVGTMHWTAALDRYHRKIHMRSRRFATAATANMLRAFARGPLAERLPARDNLRAIGEYAGDPLASGHNLW